MKPKPIQAPHRSLRGWLRHLAATDRLALIREGVALKHELAAIAKNLDGRKAALFPRPGGHKLPIVSGFISRRAWIAEAMGVGEAELLARYRDAAEHPIAWREVAAIEGGGGAALALRADVTSPDSVRAMVSAAVAKFGRVDVLVNNAALFSNLALKPFEQIDSAEWDRVMAVNVRGVFECTKAVVPEMRKRKYGKIINIASGTVFKGTPGLLHYVTSKGAVVAMTRCLARELGDDGIRVNTMAPGLTASENVVANPAWQGAVTANNVASRALKREAAPADLLGTLLYLACADSDFVTGQVVVIDGGSVMH